MDNSQVENREISTEALDLVVAGRRICPHSYSHHAHNACPLAEPDLAAGLGAVVKGLGDTLGGLLGSL